MARKLVARSRIALSQPEKTVAALCRHLADHHASHRRDGDTHHLRMFEASARLHLRPAAAEIVVEAPAIKPLYFMRQMLAEHVLEFAAPEVPQIRWEGDGTELRRPPNFQVMRVAGMQDLTPHMRRLTLAGPDVSRFDQLDALHLNVLVQKPGLATPQWPRVGDSGQVVWDDPPNRPDFRKYTVRSVDRVRGRIHVDFLLHQTFGPGSDLAARAAPGDEIGIVGPGGGGLRAADWYGFAGDETALPAIARMLEHLPPEARGRALIEVEDEAEIQPVETRSQVAVDWLLRRGEAPGARLLAELRATVLPVEGRRYLWVGCEYRAFRDIRAWQRDATDLGRDEHLIVSYWRQGMTAE
ncbi:siderophore-interacting protein [Paracoccus denitrificans]|uniref:Siderophore-interacting protein n=1 Tax=Paracoccus denitrificans (strain Pd 1222) TaxID=318586 RepID=A1B2X6_PARDP|nr:siderophore-interacting protein [Paracoccus denitrificans]ABL69870.1 Siderophore-interacting protein [Paracoccus denitrificans PD1222]MBB4626951.1 NADPH-dependent ferric siderophore reductase [Paracoccus denitrificans]MCU7428339.1 siderophore-interacting protein [Paracoccus denitrificans]QAR25266.1 siderophore-interacting protein [Paracoccus denitrificans]UPV94148.1 siderophore-interacting protein [Paracoccus denitrificans]